MSFEQHQQQQQPNLGLSRAKQLAVIGTSSKKSTASVSCGICMEPIDKEPPAGLKSCKHFEFHHKCLSTWLTRNHSCPICRSK